MRTGKRLHDTTVSEGPTGKGGIFALTDERNPFADYTVVYVPYCTGDVHIGNTTTKYAPGLTVHHKGYVNGTAALDHLAATFPDATSVVVIGESAGSVGAVVCRTRLGSPPRRQDHGAGGRIERLPRRSPDRQTHRRWGFANAVPRWRENTRPTVERWSPPRLFIQSGRHNREIDFARHDHAYDDEQDSRLSLLGIPARPLPARIDANETQIENAGVNLLSYTGPGDDHTVLSDGPFYTETVNSEKLVDWVRKLIEGKPVNDIHCRGCRVD